MPESKVGTVTSSQASVDTPAPTASVQKPSSVSTSTATVAPKTGLPPGALQAVANFQSAHAGAVTAEVKATVPATTVKTSVFPPPQPVNPNYQVNIHRPGTSAPVSVATSVPAASRSALMRRTSAVADGPVVNNRLAVETAGSVVAATVRGTAAAKAGVIPAAAAQEADVAPVTVQEETLLSSSAPNAVASVVTSQPKIPSPTRREDQQQVNNQAASQKVSTVFSGQESANEVDQSAVGQNTGSNLHQETPKDPLASAAVAYHPMPQGRRWSFNWPLLAAGAIIVVFAVALVGRFAGIAGEKREKKTSYLNSDVTNMDVAEYKHCDTRVSTDVQNTVADVVASIEGTYIGLEPETIDEDLFNAWIRPAMVADGNSCNQPFDCIQDLSGDIYFQGSVIANRYAQDTSLVVGQKVSAQDFHAWQKAIFGDVSPADLSRYPELGYDAETETFSVPAPREETLPYTFTLEKVYINTANDEAVYVALMQPVDGCSIDIIGDRCFCPRARYFLVLRYNEATNSWYHQQVTVQQLESTYDLDETNEETK